VREYYLAQKREKQQELIKTMEDIDGGEFFRQFTPISVAADFADHVAATLELAFWNRIRDDLQATPPSLNSLLSVIDEMRDIFMVLWTHSQVSRLPHAQSRQEWIMDLLDIEFIKQRGAAAITTGDLSFWRLRCEAMLDALCEVDSPAAEEEHRAWNSRTSHYGCQYGNGCLCIYNFKVVFPLQDLCTSANLSRSHKHLAFPYHFIFAFTLSKIVLISFAARSPLGMSVPE